MQRNRDIPSKSGLLGFIGKSLKIHGILWKSLEMPFGNLWKSLEIIGNVWKSLEIIGSHWKPLETNDFQVLRKFFHVLMARGVRLRFHACVMELWAWDLVAPLHPFGCNPLLPSHEKVGYPMFHTLG